jgi:hypothetical protein
MENSVYDLTISPMLRSLTNLDAIIDQAEDLLRADEGIDAATLVQARLYPNMAPFVVQVRIATDTAKGAAARLSGIDVPAWPDEEETFAEIHERLFKTINYLSGFSPESFVGALQRTVELKLGPNTVNFTGTDYIAKFVLPNFYFHVTTAYDILRHNGVLIGKRDFIGPL